LPGPPSASRRSQSQHDVAQAAGVARCAARPFTKPTKEITVYNDSAIVAPLAPAYASVAVAAHDLTRRYGDGDSAVDAVRGVSLEVPAGQFTAIMGPSGSGKSTLMHLLAGLDRPTEGSVEIAGEDITTMGDKQLTKLRRKHIGFVFQAFNLVPTLTAEENVTLPLSIARRKIDRSWVDTVIQRVGLDERRSHRPAEMSGGQQQRVAVARALVAEPTVLFADEPTGNLDSRSGAEVLQLLRDAVSAYGQTTVMVTHDAHAAATADRVVYLADGRVVADIEGATEDEILETVKELA
jgi:putative ABC transport system ATP-binding protein